MTGVPLADHRANLAGLVVDRVQAWVLARPTHRVLVRVDADGVTGWGETTPAGPGSCGAEGAAMIAAIVDRCLAPVLLGRPAWNLDGIGAAFTDAVPTGGRRARGALDLALHDLLGRALDVPVGVLWGARRTEHVPLGWTVTGASPAEAAESARAGLDQGYRAFAIDTRCGLDAAGVGAVRATVADAPLSVHAHGEYTVDGSLRMAGSLADLDVTAFVQPLAAGDIDGLRRLRAASHVPVAASPHRPRDLVNHVLSDAIDVAAIRTCGGLTDARRLCGLAEDLGTRLMADDGTEGTLGLAASLHLFAAHDIGTPMRLGGWVESPYATVVVTNGVADVPTGPGLGVDVDERVVRALAAG
ncbi:MAG TPA: enolase C-terminal domain-like protein [Pseudonocardiaceae bacterium]